MVHLLKGQNVLFAILASIAIVIAFAAGVVIASHAFDPTPGF